MPDFSFKESFPMAAVIQAAQQNAALQEKAREDGNRSFIQGMQSIGDVGESLLARKQQIAQALAAAQMYSQTDAGKEMLGTNEVTTGPTGQPVTKNQTASYNESTGAATSNQSPVVMDTLKTAFMGMQPGELLKHLAEQQKLKATKDVIVRKDAAGNIVGTTEIPRARSGKTIVVGPQPTQAPRTGAPLSEDRATLKYIEDFNKDSGVIRAKQALDGAENVRQLATSGNPIAAAAIPTYMARASGEVGNLSEPDKAPFGGTREILGKMEASLNQLANGTLTEENKNFLIELAEVMQNSATKNLDRRGREMAKQFSRVKGEKPDAVFTALRPNSKFDEPVEPPTSKDVLTVGGTFHGQKITGVKLKKP